MKLIFQQHSIFRMKERGVLLKEVEGAIATGEKLISLEVFNRNFDLK